MPLVSAAAAVHTLRCLPPLMLPSGVLGALVLLVAGAIGGLLSLAAGTVRAPPWCPNGFFASCSAAAALLVSNGGAPNKNMLAALHLVPVLALLGSQVRATLNRSAGTPCFAGAPALGTHQPCLDPPHTCGSGTSCCTHFCVEVLPAGTLLGLPAALGAA